MAASSRLIGAFPVMSRGLLLSSFPGVFFSERPSECRKAKNGPGYEGGLLCAREKFCGGEGCQERIVNTV